MDKVTSCAVLITCHNRKVHTLTCLASLFNLDNQVNQESSIDIDCYLVDDGSSDGTTVAVKQDFPNVNIIQGSGELYWNQGMRVAWKRALANKKYDYYLWLNDDVTLSPYAIEKLVKCYQNIRSDKKTAGALIGTLQDPVSLLPSYGGRNSLNKWLPLRYGAVIPPKDRPVKCNFINGNCTLISAQSVENIGILSKEFTHSMGDFDYGLRLAQNGLDCWIAPFYVGYCSSNHYRKKFKDTNLSIKERIDLIQRPTILPPPKEWIVYVKRHAGICWFIYYLKAWIRKVLPFLWVINWRNR